MTSPPGLRQAFEDVVASHGALVARIVSSYEARPALAEELVQDVFAGLWKAMGTYRGDASLKTFVARIAHNICVSHVRRAVRSPTDELGDDHPDPGESPEEQAGRSLVRRRLVAAVRELPLGQRQVVTLHLDGFTDSEIAETLGLTPGNVAVRLTRARRSLEATLGDLR